MVDAAQTQGVQVYKKRDGSDGGKNKIFGLRIRREGEKSWLDILENCESEEMKEGMKDEMKGNVLIKNNMKDMKNKNSSYRGNALYTGPSEGAQQTEVEF
ncbi:MAG: hypothetical protein D3922_15000 [Candidatus Electrothrix sp. AR1]|nr:hypothetical protein [Candidatus Electrothrix sp. AR1]